MSHPLPLGFSVAGVHCGLKRKPEKQDCSLVVSDRDAVAAGVYTQNLVFAAPVAFDRARTPGEGFRVVAINSGNANACTGDRGLRDANDMARLAAEACEAKAEQALVLSTGVIGNFLPMEKIAAGVANCASKLGRGEADLIAAARGMLTTDSTHKLASRQVSVGGRTFQLTGMAKGAAMIGPKMATMLGLLMTDAPLSPGDAQALLTESTEQSFNCISVEGHMSTNDTVLLLANGAAGGERLAGESLAKFGAALTDICMELARAIPADGEGCSHLVTIDVRGMRTRDEARQIARTVADSALVKTAIAGGDPNWGRIVSAAGYAGVPFDPAKVDLHVNGHLLYQQGAPATFDDPLVARSMRENRETAVVLDFGEGSAAIRFWTTDLTAEFVRLNADYRT